MAAKPKESLSDRIALSFQELAHSAALLNSASDELAKAIRPVDAALKKLNLGVAAWHSYRSFEDPNGDFWSRQVGYARVGRKWGLALSTVSGNSNNPGDEDEEKWLFDDAPRWMRIEAVDHIPDLLELLVKRANNVAADLQKKTQNARELADAISALSVATEARG